MEEVKILISTKKKNKLTSILTLIREAIAEKYQSDLDSGKVVYQVEVGDKLKVKEKNSDSISSARFFLETLNDLSVDDLLVIYNKQGTDGYIMGKWDLYQKNPLVWALTLSGDTLNRLIEMGKEKK